MRRLLVLTIAASQIALGGVAAAETLPCKQAYSSALRFTAGSRFTRICAPICGRSEQTGSSVLPPDGAIIMPPELERLFAARIDRQVFGHFEVCPFIRRRPGIMQMVCIAGVTNLTVPDGPE